MKKVRKLYERATDLASGKWSEAFALLFVRIVLAGIFWRSGRTKVEDGSWLQVSENTLHQFADEPFNNAPLLPSDFAAHMTTYAEHALPMFLVLGLFTRLSALALLGMTLVIQLFVFPEAWWPVHSLWIALTLVLIVRGAGILSLDHILNRKRK